MVTTVPLTAERVLTAWTLPPGVVLGCVLLAGGYEVGRRRLAARGVPWPASRTVAW